MNRLKALVTFATALFVLVPTSVVASSHREAPIAALDPKADITDVFAFRSYDGGAIPGTGKARHISTLFALSRLTAAASPFDLRDSAMSAAISRISGSPMPRVVAAGVPRRTPLGLSGGRESSGMICLFAVIPTASRMSSAAPPSNPALVTVSTTIM